MTTGSWKGAVAAIVSAVAVILLLLSVLAAGFLTVRAEAVKAAGRDDTNFFPIGLWWPPTPAETTNERYAEIAAAGFNLVLGGNGVNSPGPNQAMLKAAEAAGIKVIAADWRLNFTQDTAAVARQVVRLAAQYKTYPALLGYLLYDEPSIEQFDKLGVAIKELSRTDPERIGYVNLFPTYATAGQLGVKDYPTYVERFMTDVKPTVLSFDHYPLAGGVEQTEPDQISWDYYYNLSVIRNAALKYNVPFWAFIQSIGFSGHREPSAAELRWQINTSLAYGAKGILYFTYWTPVGSNENFGSALIDAQGRKTPRYSEAQDINRELKGLGSRLLGLTSTGVYEAGRAGGDELPFGTAELPSDGLVQEVSGGDATVGVFKDASGHSFFMIVNEDLHETRKLQVKLSPDVNSVQLYRSLTGESVDVALKSGSSSGAELTVTLGPGGAQLYAVDVES